MANLEHERIVKQGKEAIDAWRTAHRGQRLDLSGADLSRVSLSEVNLHEADFTEADLSDAVAEEADFSSARLRSSSLIGAHFFDCDLSQADLAGSMMLETNVNFSNLTGANLREANLTGARIYSANLEGADFGKAISLSTVIGHCDLSQAKNLESAEHQGGSTIGIDTILRSGGNIPEEFLRGAGVPEEIIRGLSRLMVEIQYHSCFIGYGEPNREFAERLHKDFTAQKLSCWAYSMDYTPGEHTQRGITERRQGAGKFVVLCSAAGLLKDGVLKEIEDQMDEDRDKIVPISLDRTWKAEGFPVKRGSRDLKPFLLERNYANFEEGSDYEKELNRLLKALERERG